MDKTYDEEIDRKFIYGHCLLLDRQFAPPHFHQSIELVYVESGSINANVQEEKLVITSGNVLLIGSNVMHSIYSEYGISCYVFTIPLSNLPTLGEVFTENTFATTQCKDHDGYFLNLFRAVFSSISVHGAFHATLDKMDANYINIITGISEALLYSIIHLTGMVQKSKAPDASVSIMEYIQSHYCEDINVTLLAQKLGYTPQSLTRVFKSSTNMSVKDFITSLRIQKAGELLATGKKTQEVSDILGFNCTRSFFRAFEKIYGCTPSEYKKKVSEKESELQKRYSRR